MSRFKSARFALRILSKHRPSTVLMIVTLAVGIVSTFTTVGGNQMAEVALIVAVASRMASIAPRAISSLWA